MSKRLSLLEFAKAYFAKGLHKTEPSIVEKRILEMLENGESPHFMWKALGEK